MEHGSAPTDPVHAQIAALVHEVTGTDVGEVGLDRRFVSDLGVDSLSMIEIMVGVEETMGCVVPDEQVRHLVTVADLVDFVTARA